MSTKDELLECLKEGKGTWLSGEALGHRLSISRTAIWKQISALKKEGYLIESSRKKGHMLNGVPDCLFESEIREGLGTCVFGKKNILHFIQAESTNMTAETLANQGAAEGTVVVAEHQTKGRGRLGRTWFSPGGEGIYVSVILRPSIPPNDAPKLTLMASVAVAEAIRTCAPVEASIKWPNDIMIGGRKVAGILTEMSTDMDRIHYVIIGMGININNPSENFPYEIREIATSLFSETGKIFSRAEILRKCLESLERYYETFKEKGFLPIMKRWEELTEMMGATIRVDAIGNTYSGTFKGINEDGFLVMRDSYGGVKRIISGDVSIVNR